MARKTRSKLIRPMMTGPTLQELLDAISDANAEVETKSANVIAASDALAGALADYETSLENLQDAITNEVGVEAAAAAVLTANIAYTTAQVAYGESLNALNDSRFALVLANEALSERIMSIITTPPTP